MSTAQVSADASLEFPVKGTLKRCPFPRLLREIASGALTGSLYLLSDETKKVVFFEQGQPVFVRSNVLSECLGQVLAQEGLITQEQCEQTLEAIRRTGKKQGELLVEMGILSEGNLRYGLAAQLRTKLFEIFSWENGRYQFKRDTPDVQFGIRLESCAEGVIIEAIQDQYSEERARGLLRPSATKYPVARPNGTSDGTALSLLAEERYYLQCLDGSRSVDDLLESPPDPVVPSPAALLLGLSESGVVELVNDAMPAQPTPPLPKLAPGDNADVALAPAFAVSNEIAAYEDTPLPGELPKAPGLLGDHEDDFAGVEDSGVHSIKPEVDEELVAAEHDEIDETFDDALIESDPSMELLDDADFELELDIEAEPEPEPAAQESAAPESAQEPAQEPAAIVPGTAEAAPEPAPVDTPTSDADEPPMLVAEPAADEFPPLAPIPGVEEAPASEPTLPPVLTPPSGGPDALTEPDSIEPYSIEPISIEAAAVESVDEPELTLDDEPELNLDEPELNLDEPELNLDEPELNLDEPIGDLEVDDDLLDLAGDDDLLLGDAQPADGAATDADLDDIDLGDIDGDLDLGGDDLDGGLEGDLDLSDLNDLGSESDSPSAAASPDADLMGLDDLDGVVLALDDDAAAAPEPEVDPETLGAQHFSEAETALGESRFDDAVDLLEQAYENGFDVAELHAMLAYSRYKASGQDEATSQHAFELLDYAQNMDPSLDLVHAYRGAILHATGQTDQARESLDRALELNPYCELAMEIMDSMG